MDIVCVSWVGWVICVCVCVSRVGWDICVCVSGRVVHKCEYKHV